MALLTVKERMARSIARRKGEVVVRSDFEAMGSASQISRALKELLKDGKIVRLGYGVYAKAKPSIFSGKPGTRVSLEEITAELMQKLGMDIRVGSAAAEYASARTTQIPVWATFNTGKRRLSRKIGVGIRLVRFESDYGKKRCEDVGLRLASLEIRPPSKTAALVCRCLNEMAYGERFSVEDFRGIGPQELVEETLAKLVKVDAIRRVRRGDFLR